MRYDEVAEPEAPQGGYDDDFDEEWDESDEPAEAVRGIEEREGAPQARYDDDFDEEWDEFDEPAEAVPGMEESEGAPDVPDWAKPGLPGEVLPGMPSTPPPIWHDGASHVGVDPVTSAPAVARFVNICLLPEDRSQALPSDRPLLRDTRYLLRVHIGRLDRESIVADAQEHPFPAEHLPKSDVGHWLSVAAVSSDFLVPQGLFDVFLPRYGESWSCNCPRGAPHCCNPNQREPHVLIPVSAPSQPGPAFLRALLYYQNNLLQSLLVSADVVETPDASGAYLAHTDFTLSEDLTDIDGFRPRLLNVLTNEVAGGTHRMVFKNGDVPFDLTFGEGQITAAMGEIRERLLDIHVKKGRRKLENRLLPGNRKDRDEFIDDLASVARKGYDHWLALFVEAGDPLLHEQEGSSRAIQIARVPRTEFVYPWAAVYDMPLDTYEGVQHEPCPVVADWDGDTPLVDGYPSRCPYEAEHPPKNAICPFGFWGFRYAIEHPTGGGMLTSEINVVDPPNIVVALSTALDQGEVQRHLRELATALPGFDIAKADTRDSVCATFADPTPEFAYFYCHGGTTRGGDPCLIVGEDDEVPASQILTWHLTDWSAPDHWSRTRPLVILNGCHTAALTPLSPVNFVDAFSSARAGGVVGTEITLHQTMASEAAEVLFGHLVGGEGVGVGEALRRMRLHFLSKGNLLGLAYTAYCSADLRVLLAR